MALRLTGSIDFLTGAITTDQHGVYSGSFSGSGHITSASYSDFALTASHALNSGGYGVYSGSFSGSGHITSASYSDFALTASHALNSGGGGNAFPHTGSAVISGSFGVTGSTRIKNEVNIGGGSFQSGQWNNPSTNASFPLSPVSSDYCFAFSAAGCDITKTIAVAGLDTNFNYYNESYAYDGSVWSTLSTLPTSFNGSATMTGDCDDAIIGCDQNGLGNYLSYDGSTNTWAFIGVPLICCSQPAMVGNCNNGAFQYGGTDSNNNSSTETFCWNNGTWSSCNFLPYNVNYHLFAGNPSDAVALGGYNSTLGGNQAVNSHINWDGIAWNACADLNFARLDMDGGPIQGLTGCTSPSLLYASPGLNAAYDGTTWSVAPSGGSIITSNWYDSCDISPFWLTGDNTCAMGFWNFSFDFNGVDQFGCLTKYCYGTPPVMPTSIWCTPSSPTLNAHGTTTFRSQNGLAGCSSAALVYGGNDANFNSLSSAEIYNGSTWSTTSNGPAPKCRMIGGGSANESIWVGGQNFNFCNDHFEYNSGNWSVCAFTPFFTGTESDMGAGSQTAFKIVGCQGHWNWNGSGWIQELSSPNNVFSPSGFGTQNDFLQVGGESNFNSTSDVYKWDGMAWNLCNSTPWTTYCGGGAGSVSNGLIYNYSNNVSSFNIVSQIASLAWNGNTWSQDALSNLTSDNDGYTNNSNSALTPETAMVFGAANCMNLRAANEPRCSTYFSTYSTNIGGGGGTTGVYDVAKFEGGMVVLPLVQSTYDFVDDAAAATGGVPLGGLYRNGSDIKIRLT